MADLSTPPSTRIKDDFSRNERSFKPEARKALYKNESKNLEWKEAYRQRCSERLKRKREKEFNKRRTMSPVTHNDNNTLLGTVYDVMQEEWDHLRSETHLPALSIRGGEGKRQLSSPSCSLECKRLHQEDHEYLMYTPERTNTCTNVHVRQWSSPDEESYDIDEILAIMEEITQELIKEEEELLVASYEESLQFTDRAIEATMEGSDDVVCPMCLRDVLCQDQEKIYCPSCDLFINTAQDGISLEYLRIRLNEGVTRHNESCSSPPIFSHQQDFLTMNCQHCDFLYIII